MPQFFAKKEKHRDWKMRKERHHNLSNRCLKEERVPFRHRRSVLRIVQYQEERRTDE